MNPLTINAWSRGGVAVQRGVKRLATTYAVERAALEMFVLRGFDAVTCEEIARAAGISVRTFFRHFPQGKEGVLLLETRRGVELFEQALLDRPPGEEASVAVRHAALESVRMLDEPTGTFEGFGLPEAMHVFGQVVSGHPELLARMMGERQMLMEGLVDLVALRMSVDPRRDIRPRLLLHLAHAAITVAWLSAWNNAELSRSAVLAEALAILDHPAALLAVPAHAG